MLVDEVITRIKSEIGELENRCEGAAELSELVRSGQWPQSPVFAFVLPLGLRPLSQGDASAGAFTQMLSETIGILLVIQAAGDGTGRKALPKIETLLAALLAALPGWGPEDATGVFAVSRGQLISATDGRVVYQLDLSLNNQLRNTG